MNVTNGTKCSNQLVYYGKELLGKSLIESKKEKLLACSIHFSCSKWKNVKSTATATLWQTQKQRKAKREESHAVIMTKLGVDLRNALYKDKKLNADPKSNPDLAKVIKQAQAIKIPSDIIRSVIDNQIQKKEQAVELNAFTARGLNNTGMVVEVYTPKFNKTQNDVQNMIKRTGLKTGKSAADLFEHKGIIDVALPEEERSVIKSDPGKFDLDKYVDLAIESGADVEDVKLVSGIDLPFLQFECSPTVVDTVHSILEDAGLVVLSSEAIYLPNSTVPVENEFLELIAKSEQRMLADLPGFKGLYCNVEPKES